jgi:lysophospholipase L1-like esterase
MRYVPSLFLVAALAAVATLAAAAPAAEPPRVVRENIEWLDLWVPGNNTDGLPRVLLIGDSITKGYYAEVEARLKGKAVIARLATSKSVGDPALITEIALALAEAKFDAVHFNNGLHGWGYTEDEYAAALPDLVAAVRKGAPGAKLLWASTTPIRQPDKPDQLDPKTERVKARNKIAAALMAQEKMATDDLYDLVNDKPEWYAPDGTHFNAKGTAVLGGQVAVLLIRALADASR